MKKQYRTKRLHIKQNLNAMDNALYYDIRKSLPTSMLMIAIILFIKPSPWHMIISIIGIVLGIISTIPMLQKILNEHIKDKRVPFIQIIQQSSRMQKIAHRIGVILVGSSIALILPKTIESIVIIATLALAMLSQYAYGYYKISTKAYINP